MANRTLEISDEGVIFCEGLTCVSPLFCSDCPLYNIANLFKKDRL